MAKSKESIEFTPEEMDLCFAALDKLQKESAKAFQSCDKLGIKKAVSNVIEFREKVEELKQKFLHE